MFMARTLVFGSAHTLFLTGTRACVWLQELVCGHKSLCVVTKADAWTLTRDVGCV